MMRPANLNFANWKLFLVKTLSATARSKLWKFIMSYLVLLKFDSQFITPNENVKLKNS